MSSLNILTFAMLTDIHFGAKGNSEQHNQDCLDYLTWFCTMVRENTEIEAVVFLGDWYENRNALNIATMTYSYKGAKMLNDLGIPVFMIIGNHDLYRRHTRDIHSVVKFNEFSNFKVITEPVVVKNKPGDILLCPFMFEHEYESLLKYRKVPVWMGHFEFRGFVLTGSDTKMEHGPDHTNFKGPKTIFSGHFHKRQQTDNVIYIGNTFPTNFSDANDFERGMAIYDVEANDTTFHDWPDAPKYIKTKLSKILKGKVKFPAKAYVKCVVDVPISYEESSTLKHSFTEKYELREFMLEESPEIQKALMETDADDIDMDLDFGELGNIDDLVVQMLDHIDTDHINNKTLIEIYNGLTKPI